MALDADTLAQLLETIRRFAAERLRPIEAQVAENDKIPDEVLAEMRELGLYGLTIPEEYGGLNLTTEEECLAILEMGRVSPAFRSAFGTNVGIGSQGLVMFGTEEQKAKYLPGIASGEIVTSFCLTEPEAGSDSGSVQTRADRDGDFYVLNGTKRYITNAARAGLFTVMARTDQSKKGGSGVSSILVEAGTPGITVGKSENKMGQKGAHIHDVIFDNVRVPVANRLGGEGEGFKVAMLVLDRGRFHVAALAVGMAERLIADSVAYAAERKQFGQPIASFQLIQGMIADSKTEAMAARALLLDGARKRDRGEPVALEAAAAKYYCTEMVGRVADRAVQIFGGAGYVADHGIERCYRDVRIFRIYEGTSQIQQVIIARETMKAGG
jgi:acyl-CoA dehydrogenase